MSAGRGPEGAAGQGDVAARVAQKHPIVTRIRDEVARVVVGQEALVDRLLIGLFTREHVLIEGVPGLAKTTAVKALAGTVDADFKRIQFTPDLLPADLTGTEVFEPRTGEFTVRQGPLFHHIILADEINRAPAKVQSALLEAMQERQVTIGGRTLSLDEPFLVLATQNPIEQDGTYPLPEAQMDRFMMKLTVGYPSRDEEKEIVRRAGLGTPAAQPVARREEIVALRALIDEIHVEEVLLDYLVDLVAATRRPEAFGLDLGGYIRFGASPRASIYLSLAARARAFLEGRAYATPADVKSVAPDVLRHRIVPTYEAEADEVGADQLIGQILAHVPLP